MDQTRVGDESKGQRNRVLIVDDHAIVRLGIRMLLDSTGDVEVVGEAGDAAEALARVRELSPDVVLMDLALPGVTGLEATRDLLRFSPSLRVLILTMHEDEEYFFEAVNARASGYVLKEAVPTELLSTLRTVYQGGTACHPALARRLLDDYLRRVRAGHEGGR